MPIRHLFDLELNDKRVLIRQDLNVPVESGVVASDARIQASLPTLIRARDEGARVMIMSHLGRPTEGQIEGKYSLAPVAEHLSRLLESPVRLVKDYLETSPDVAIGEVVLLENVRFNDGEKNNDDALSKAYASLCDIYAMDAFGTAHRAQASTYGAGMHAPVACAGPLLAGELSALAKVMDAPARPLVAIVGGSKVSTKLTVLDALAELVDQLIVGGGIANTFIAAAGHNVGQSLLEEDLLDDARRLMEQAARRGAQIPVPADVVCAKEFDAGAAARICAVSDVQNDELILDIGPQTRQRYAEYLKGAGTVVWNGPVGVFEFDQFGEGTRAIAESVAASTAFSVAGGGDTLAAVDKYGVQDQISYISTGGGAFLEFLEGKKLPAVEMLELRYSGGIA